MFEKTLSLNLNGTFMDNKFIIICTGVVNPTVVIEQLLEDKDYKIATIDKEAKELIYSTKDGNKSKYCLSHLVDWEKTIENIPGEFCLVSSFMGELFYHRRTKGKLEDYKKAVVEYFKGFTQYKIEIHKITFENAREQL